MQNTYGLFPIIMSNDPCKNKFNHASAKSVPTFGRACVLYGELRVKWTCVIFADFGHSNFNLKMSCRIFFFFLPRFAYQECQNFQLNLCAEFCACKKYSMRLSDGRFCPRIGALMIHREEGVWSVCNGRTFSKIWKFEGLWKISGEMWWFALWFIMMGTTKCTESLYNLVAMVTYLCENPRNFQCEGRTRYKFGCWLFNPLFRFLSKDSGLA